MHSTSYVLSNEHQGSSSTGQKCGTHLHLICKMKIFSEAPGISTSKHFEVWRTFQIHNYNHDIIRINQIGIYWKRSVLGTEFSTWATKMRYLLKNNNREIRLNLIIQIINIYVDIWSSFITFYYWVIYYWNTFLIVLMNISYKNDIFKVLFQSKIKIKREPF